MINRNMCAFNAVDGLAIKVNSQLYMETLERVPRFVLHLPTKLSLYMLTKENIRSSSSGIIPLLNSSYDILIF